MANENDESETIREIVWLPIDYMQVFAPFRSETDSEGLGAQKAQSFARMVAFGEPEGFFFSLCDLPASVSAVDPPDFATCIETKDGNFGSGEKFCGCEKN